jgi:colicin import membrane protein
MDFRFGGIVRDKLSIAAIAVSALVFVVVLVSPAPQAPPESAGTRSEGIVNRGQVETNALDEDARELERLTERSAALGALHGKGRPDDAGAAEVISQMIARETKRRWPAFRNQLKIIKLYEKREPAKAAPTKAGAGKAPAAKPAAGKAVADEAVADEAVADEAAARKAVAAKAAAARKKAAKAAAKRAAALKAREAARKKAAEQKARHKKGDQERVEGGEW